MLPQDVDRSLVPQPKVNGCCARTQTAFNDHGYQNLIDDLSAACLPDQNDKQIVKFIAVTVHL